MYWEDKMMSSAFKKVFVVAGTKKKNGGRAFFWNFFLPVVLGAKDNIKFLAGWLVGAHFTRTTTHRQTGLCCRPQFNCSKEIVGQQTPRSLFFVILSSVIELAQLLRTCLSSVKSHWFFFGVMSKIPNPQKQQENQQQQETNNNNKWSSKVSR